MGFFTRQEFRDAKKRLARADGLTDNLTDGLNPNFKDSLTTTQDTLSSGSVGFKPEVNSPSSGFKPNLVPKSLTPNLTNKGATPGAELSQTSAPRDNYQDGIPLATKDLKLNLNVDTQDDVTPDLAKQLDVKPKLMEDSDLTPNLTIPGVDPGTELKQYEYNSPFVELTNRFKEKLDNGGLGTGLKVLGDAMKMGAQSGQGQMVSGFYVPNSGGNSLDLSDAMDKHNQEQQAIANAQYQRQMQMLDMAIKQQGANTKDKEAYNTAIKNNNDATIGMGNLGVNQQNADTNTANAYTHATEVDYKHAIDKANVILDNKKQVEQSLYQMNELLFRTNDANAKNQIALIQAGMKNHLDQLDAALKEQQAIKLKYENQETENKIKADSESLKANMEQAKSLADKLNLIPDSYFAGGTANRILRLGGEVVGSKNYNLAKSYASRASQYMISQLKADFGAQFTKDEGEKLENILTDWSVPKATLYANLRNEVKKKLAEKGKDVGLVDKLLPPMSDPASQKTDWSK